MSDKKSKVEFRVGDRVKALTNVGYRHGTKGEIGTVICIKPENSMLVEFDNNIAGHDGNGVCEVSGKNGHCWFVKPCDLQLVSENQTVVIYPKGPETFAVLKEGKKIVKIAQAMYNPNDAKEGLPYKFEIGAKLAFSRLMGEDASIINSIPSITTIPNFIDWDEFKAGKIAVHCNTEEKAKAFLRECDARGIKWCGGDKASKETRYHVYGVNTCYAFATRFSYCYSAEGFGFGSLKTHKDAGYTIVDYPWSLVDRNPATTPPFRKAKKGDIVRITKGNLKGREFAIFHVAPNSVEAKGCNLFYGKDESYVIVKEAPEDTGIKVGDTVRVIQNLYCYQRYHEWMEKFALTYAGRYAYGTSPSGGFIGKVVAKHKHGPSERMLYAIQDQVSDAVYLIDERGIEKVNG